MANAAVGADVTVDQVMTRDVKTLDRNQTLDIADDVMGQARLRHLPVIDAGEVVGVVSQRDMFRSALAAALGYGDRGQKALLHTLHVKDVMSEPAVTIGPSTPLSKAARLMLDKKIGCLPVVDGSRLVGILTETDLIRHAYEG